MDSVQPRQGRAAVGGEGIDETRSQIALALQSVEIARAMTVSREELREGGWDLPAPDQIGYVVRDLDFAIAVHERIFGPFTTMEVTLDGPLYRGRPRDCSLRIAYGHAGPLEIELIQPVAGESPHAEFLAAGHEGIHHLRFRIDDFHAHLAAAARLGYRPIWQHSMDIADFAYLEHEEQKGMLIELLRM
jgi:methylmalonyl-CoA/ethylmalonyl-CoA epimerase